MRSALFFLALVMCTRPAVAADTCVVTPAPEPPFVPPSGFDAFTAGGNFLYGTPGLWAYVHTHWKLGGLDGNKLPYFSQYYDWKTEKQPHMTVEARRLDAPAPAVTSERVNGAGPSFRYGEQPDLTKPGFMVTALHIPTAGCWQITARYTPPSGKGETLSYTILVEP